MQPTSGASTLKRRKPIPRGVATAAPPILSYGFRPFFLLAGIFAVLDMIAWVGALSGWWSVGGSAGPIAWHAHEMLFGYTAAAMCGFVLTAVPNWTGRLPISGFPLLALATIWLGGRIVATFPWLLGEFVSSAIDWVFIPVLSFVVAREVIIGKNWQNIRVAAGIACLGALNSWFLLANLLEWESSSALRLTVSTYVLLISHIGGRIVPSFTRNYLAKHSRPVPWTSRWIDNAALFSTLCSLLVWSLFPEWWGVLPLGLMGAGFQAVRLSGWKGWSTIDEPLLAVLHLAYGFVPLGLVAIGTASVGLLSTPSALHLLTVGAIGMMTLAVMTRASRGHTGHPLTSSRTTTFSYGCLLLASFARPLAETSPTWYDTMLTVSAVSWIVTFALFVLEHGPMLVSEKARPRGG